MKRIIKTTESNKKGGYCMLMTIAAIIGIIWLIGFAAHIGGGLIHILIVIALVIIIYDLLVGRRRGHGDVV